MDIFKVRKKHILSGFVSLGLISILVFVTFSNSVNNQQKGILTLTFDDGLKSQYELAFKEMQKYGYNGMLFLLANQTDFFEGRELMTFKDAKEMQDNGWEIGSHGMIHEPINQENLYSQIVTSKEILSSKGFFIDSFACPKGCNESIKDLRKIGEGNYITVRSINWGENDLEDYNPKELSSKWVNNVDTAQEVCNWVKFSKENNKWLILTFHGIDKKNNPVHPYDFAEENFREVLSCINKSNMKVATIREVIKNE